MSGKGKAVYGKGKGFIPRRNANDKDALERITKPSIRRCARRGGVKRIAGPLYSDVRSVINVCRTATAFPATARLLTRTLLAQTFSEKVLKDALEYTACAKRKTVNALDVIHAMDRNGQKIYGRGHPSAPGGA